jgi:hypothetical protein
MNPNTTVGQIGSLNAPAPKKVFQVGDTLKVVNKGWHQYIVDESNGPRPYSDDEFRNGDQTFIVTITEIKTAKVTLE